MKFCFQTIHQHLVAGCLAYEAVSGSGAQRFSGTDEAIERAYGRGVSFPWETPKGMPTAVRAAARATSCCRACAGSRHAGLRPHSCCRRLTV